MSDILQLYQRLSSGQAVEIELLFPNLTFRRGKDGPIHRVSFEVEEAVWTALKYLPANLRLRAQLQVIPDDEQSPAQRINGKAWSLLLHGRRGFARCPGVWERIADQAGADDHAKMRALFQVEHLSQIDERAALEMFTAPNAQTMLRQAWADARQALATG